MQPEGLQQVVQAAYMKTFWLPRNQAHHLQSIVQIPQHNDSTDREQCQYIFSTLLTFINFLLRYDTIEEINVDSKAEYTA